jgi:hypothetical protein
MPKQGGRPNRLPDHTWKRDNVVKLKQTSPDGALYRL